MTRMSRNWLGEPGSRPSVSRTCTIVAYIFLGVCIVQAALGIAMEVESCIGGELRFDFDTGKQYIQCLDGTKEQPSDVFLILNTILGVIGGLFGIYMFMMICKTRAAMRSKFNIPGGCFEDCCCSWFLRVFLVEFNGTTTVSMVHDQLLAS